MDTRFASPAPLPLAEPRSFDTVVRTRAPAVGNLAKGLDGSLLFPVRVPVLRNGELRYVLTAVVKPEEILDVVKRQRVPSDWSYPSSTRTACGWRASVSTRRVWA